MKRLLLLLTCLGLSLSIAACGDDAEDTGGGATENNSTANNSTANNSTANNSTANNSTANNTATNNENNTATNNENNTATNNENNTGTNNANNENNSGANNDTGEPGTPADYANYGQGGARISGLTLYQEPVDGFDFNGDGAPDNGLGGVLGLLGGALGGDGGGLQGTIDEAIADGSIAFGAIFVGAPADISAASTTDFHMFLLEDADGDVATTDEYLATAESFLPNSKTPRVRFEGAAISGGELEAGPEDFFLNIPVAGIELNLTISDARILGTLGGGSAGVTLSDGFLVGVVSIDSIIGALNSFLNSDTCSCLGLTEDLIAVDGVNISCTATPNTDACNTDDNDVCGTIAGACGLLGILGGVLDVDSDGDGVNDSLSVVIGLEMDATVISGPAQ